MGSRNHYCKHAAFLPTTIIYISAAVFALHNGWMSIYTSSIASFASIKPGNTMNILLPIVIELSGLVSAMSFARCIARSSKPLAIIGLIYSLILAAIPFASIEEPEVVHVLSQVFFAATIAFAVTYLVTSPPPRPSIAQFSLDVHRAFVRRLNVGMLSFTSIIVWYTSVVANWPPGTLIPELVALTASTIGYLDVLREDNNPQ
ncbi:hypothetical protein PYJP_13060 [Pyrofollis japonicus]|uniref:hypothetical protein n=1 Tax=Pyrofollis japonicus TaxID=3060460 RepID=UPI00295BA5B5|nr:hypothetical protein [Pyrofollis japonicus]BEP17954.1 hypothetical protein PYJP_13060 [Pyrofollis japonicus]